MCTLHTQIYKEDLSEVLRYMAMKYARTTRE